MRTQSSLMPLGWITLSLGALAAVGCSERHSARVVIDSGALVQHDAHSPAPDTGENIDAFVTPIDAEIPEDAGAEQDAAPDTEASRDAGRSIDAATDLCEVAGDLGSELGAALATGTTEGGPTGTPSCGSEGPVQRFDWQAPEDGTFVFSLEGSTYDTLLSIQRTCDRGTGLGCDDDRLGLQSRVDVALHAGDRVVVVVAGFVGETGHFSLSIRDSDSVAVSETSRCDDGEDDDLDGRIDCRDSDCSSSDPGCVETSCDDGVDDDRDGSTDCRDWDCRGAEACTEHDCGDSLDDDGDGSTDCEDSDCIDAPVCTEHDCEDGMDNDLDSSIDCDDRDCRFACRDCSIDDDLGSAVGMRIYAGSTVDGSNESVPGCSSFSTAPEKVLQWSAPEAGTYTFSLAGSSYDTLLYAMNSCEAAVELACNDDSRGTARSLITLTLASGESVLLFVDGYGSGSGEFTISIALDAPINEAGFCGDADDNDFDERTDCTDSDCRAECL